MVLISDKKYACETCIKGHRSSACTHTDRPLFEIKKKGRPVTQCEHCRELRKTKQVHVKCLCESKEEGAPPKAPKALGKKKGGNKVPESAAFPHGLPQGLEALVVLQPLEGSSDSDHSGEGGCNCKIGGECHCCTPRKSVPRSRKLVARALSQSGEEVISRANTNAPSKRPLPGPSSNAPLSSHILARIAELRPVLPRPITTTGPLHDPSSGIAHGSGVRHHTHENMFFSPYGRAYGHVHSTEHISYDRSTRDDRAREVTTAARSSSTAEIFSPDVSTPAWPNGGTFPSLCRCGDTCSCPGCVEHNPNATVIRANDPNVFASCANPGACSSCLDCTILSLPSSLPPDSILSLYGEDPAQIQSIDEWIRKVATLPPLTSSHYMPPPATWDTTPLPRISEPTTDSCSDTECKCPPGSCTCESSYCGFCQGCACEDLDHHENLSFATSSGGRACAGENQIGIAPVLGRRSTDFLRMPPPGQCCNGSGSPSSLSSQPSSSAQGLMGLGRVLQESTTSNLVVRPSGVPSRGSSTIATPPPISRAASSQDSVVYAHSNPNSSPSRSDYNISTLYPVSNPDSDHSEYEYRQSTGSGGVYALSNPDSELSHEEFDYDPRFEFAPGAAGGAGAGGSGENLGTYPTSNPDSEPPLEDLEKFEYDPSLDEMQIY